MSKFLSIGAMMILAAMLVLVGCSNPANSDPKDDIPDDTSKDTSKVVFDDAPQNGFDTGVASADGDATIAADSQDASNPAGGKSVKINIVTAKWGGGYFINDEGVDVSAYKTLNFSAKTDMTGVAFLELKLEDLRVVDPTSTVGVKKGNLLDAAKVSGLTAVADASNPGWTNYTVTLDEIKEIDWTQFKTIGFWNPQDAQYQPVTGDLFIDNVRFVK